jgi:hypothetical protein
MQRMPLRGPEYCTPEVTNINFFLISYQYHGPKSDILSCTYHFQKSDM